MSKLFDEWWALYPAVRRQNKKGCLAIWVQKGLDAQGADLVAHLRRRVQEDVKWADGFVPMPATFLRQERWQDEYQRRGNTVGGPRHAAPPPAAPPADPWRQPCAWRAYFNLVIMRVIVNPRGGLELEHLRRVVAERNRLADQCREMWGPVVPPEGAREYDVLAGMLRQLEAVT